MSRFLLAILMCTIFPACTSLQLGIAQESSLRRYSANTAQAKNESVILLHGLSRTSQSMQKMAFAMADEGYAVCSINYPSRFFSVEILAVNYVLPRIKQCIKGNPKKLNFITHSLGGIVIRQLDSELKAFNTGRLVMLSPPNQGSEAVDKLSRAWGFQQMAGPAGNELGTSADSLPQTLPSPSMPFAVIAARHSNSAMSFLIPGDDDGKVSLARMQLPEMLDFVIVNSTHSFMMKNPDTINHVINFLKTEAFIKDNHAK